MTTRRWVAHQKGRLVLRTMPTVDGVLSAATSRPLTRGERLAWYVFKRVPR